jgi:hypothetical protein
MDDLSVGHKPHLEASIPRSLGVLGVLSVQKKRFVPRADGAPALR